MIENKKDQDHREKGTKIRRSKALKKDKQITELKIMYANANGIGDKINSIQSASELYGAHIIAITETKQIPTEDTRIWEMDRETKKNPCWRRGGHYGKKGHSQHHNKSGWPWRRRSRSNMGKPKKEQ